MDGKQNNLLRMLRREIWERELSSMSPVHAFLVRIVRVVQLVLKGFQEDDLAVHASSLTFVTLMSLVPMLAVVFAFLKGFGFGQGEIDKLLEWKDTMPSQFQAFIDQILYIVNSTNFAAMGGVGFAFFIFTAVLVLGSMEVSFNRIWGVTTPRSMIRQAANYIAILFLVPVLIMITGMMEASIKTSVFLLPETVDAVVKNLFRLTSLFTSWLAFWFLYVFLPNTKVRLAPGLISGLVAALLWLLWQKAYMSLQFGVARYNAIYGTFASVPIFLAWLYTSWVIVLLGAELAFALQNSATFEMESAAESANARSKMILALSILKHAAEAMTGSAPRFDASHYVRKHRVPVRLINELVRLLVREGYLAELSDRQGSYVLVKAPETVRVGDVVETILQSGAKPETLGLMKMEPDVEDVLSKFQRGVEGSLDPLTLKDLLSAAPNPES